MTSSFSFSCALARNDMGKQRKRASLSISATSSGHASASPSVSGHQSSSFGVSLADLEESSPTRRGPGRPPGRKSNPKHSALMNKLKKAANRLTPPMVPAVLKLQSKSSGRPLSPNMSRLTANRSPLRAPRLRPQTQAGSIGTGDLAAGTDADGELHQSRADDEQRSVFALTKRSPLRTGSRGSSASSSRSPGRLMSNTGAGAGCEASPSPLAASFGGTGSVAESSSTAPSTLAPDIFASASPPPPAPPLLPPQPQNTVFRKAAPVAIGGQFLAPGTFIVTSTAHPHSGPRMRFPVVSASVSALGSMGAPSTMQSLPTAIRVQRGPITAIVTPTAIITPLSVRGMLPFQAVHSVGGPMQLGSVQLGSPNMLPVLHVRSPAPLPVICTISPPRASVLNMQQPAMHQLAATASVSAIPISLSSAPASASFNQTQAPMVPIPISLSSPLAPAPHQQFSVISANPISLVPIQFTSSAGATVQRPAPSAATPFFPTAQSALPPTPTPTPLSAVSLAGVSISVAAAPAQAATVTLTQPQPHSTGGGDRSFSSELSALFSNVVAGIGIATSSASGALTAAAAAAPRPSAAAVPVPLAAGQSAAAAASGSGAPLEIDLSLPLSFTGLGGAPSAVDAQRSPNS